jgi:hypothetical protein
LDVIAGFVSRVRNKLLAEMLPALSLAVGANKTDALGANYDMNTLKTGWPTERDESESPGWRHCDIREMAYPYVHKLFDRISELGALKP